MAVDPALAVVFPGQGSQRPGMALPWSDHPAAGRWREADEILGWGVSRLGTDAAAAELLDPLPCQVALFVHHAVLWDAWAAGGERPGALAGHSLGEYSALYAAGAVDFASGLRLVAARATATAEAAARSPGRMVACLGYDLAAVRIACAEAGAHLANDNAPAQVTVSGSPEALDRLQAALPEGGGRVVALEVGAAYHSPHMEAAVPALTEALAATAFHDPVVPVIANVDAAAHVDAITWPRLLAAQLTAPVRWRETVLTLVAHGVEEVVELGASPVLSNLLKRSAPNLRRLNPRTPQEVAA